MELRQKKKIKTSFLMLPIALILFLPGCKPDKEPSGPRDNSKNYWVSTFAGSAMKGFANGEGTQAKFTSPNNVTTDLNGNIYVTDFLRVRKISKEGIVTTLAGGSLGYADGSFSQAQFRDFKGITCDHLGNISIADEYRIRKLTPSGVVTTFAGSRGGYSDGSDTAAKFSSLYGIAADGLGNLYVADENKIRKITPGSQVTTVYTGTGVFSSITVDKNGNIYGVQPMNSGSTVFRIMPFGDKIQIGQNIPSVTAITINSAGEIFLLVSPTYLSWFGNRNHYVYKLDTRGSFEIIVTENLWGFADGSGTTAKFNDPLGIAADEFGNVYIADRDNFRIRKIRLLP